VASKRETILELSGVVPSDVYQMLVNHLFTQSVFDFLRKPIEVESQDPAVTDALKMLAELDDRIAKHEGGSNPGI